MSTKLQMWLQLQASTFTDNSPVALESCWILTKDSGLCCALEGHAGDTWARRNAAGLNKVIVLAVFPLFSIISSRVDAQTLTPKQLSDPFLHRSAKNNCSCGSHWCEMLQQHLTVFLHQDFFFPLTMRNSHYSGSYKIHQIPYTELLEFSNTKIQQSTLLSCFSNSIKFKFCFWFQKPQTYCEAAGGQPALIPAPTSPRTSPALPHYPYTGIHQLCIGTHSSATSCSSSQASLCVSWLLPVLLHVHILSLYRSNRASYSL